MSEISEKAGDRQFVVLSILWGQIVDKTPPDRFDIIGGALCIAGVGVIMYWPR